VTVVNLDVRVEAGDGPADSVPAVWSDPPAWAATLDAGVGLVIVGRIRRRFFRAGGTTQSRTEVVVERATRAALRRQATATLAGAATTLEAAAAESARPGWPVAQGPGGCSRA
jgi:single-strand DNA-binding protein